MDAAALSLNIDSSSVVKAANDLERFSTVSEKAAAAGKKISLDGASGSIAKLVASVQSIDSKLGAIVSAMSRLSAANDNVAASSKAAAVAVAATANDLAKVGQAAQQADAHVGAFRAQMAAMPQTFQQADAHVIAYRNSLAQVGDGARAASAAIKFTALDGLSATRQLADIGVTAAMGMNPFMIALQQGPQLFDILQNKAVMTGQTIGAVFRAAGVAIWTALAPILPVIAAIALAVGGIAAAFALGTREIEKGQGKVVDGLSLTEKQMEKLKKAGVDTGVTLGDTFSAFFSVIKSRLADAFETPIKAVSKAWNSFLNDTTSSGRAALKDVVGTFVGGYFAIVALWKTLPKTFEGIGALVANGFIAIIENMINRVIRSMNDLNGRVNEAANLLGLGNIIPKLQDVSFGRVVNKEAQATAGAIAKGYQEGYAAAGAATDRFFTDVAKKARENARKRIRAAAGDAGASGADTAAKAASATPAEDKWGDLIANADRQQRALEQAGAQIGLYGQDLSRLRHEQELLNAAADKGLKLTEAQNQELMARAAKMAATEYENTRKRAVTDSAASHAEAMRQLEVERGALGLTGEALATYNYQQQKINEALAAGVALKDIDIGKIAEQAQEYGKAVAANEAARQAIEDQKRAVEDAREVTRGFFADFINGAREGQGFFKSFADSVVNSLNRIIDKLLDKALTGFIDGIDFGKGGSGGFLGGLFGSKSSGLVPAQTEAMRKNPWTMWANGGAFGTAQRFAQGGAFTNQIVTSPTLFRFAKGSALGEMGEAGPEAIMPLKRGPNGSLGVQMHGGGRGPIRMGDVYNTYQVNGAFDRDQVLGLIRQGGVATYDQVKRDLQSMLAEIDQNGTVAS